jgi:DNA-binding transcriptional LysR family regulator
MTHRLSRSEWPDLHKLRVFAVTAQHEHFSRAAESLHISQPAVSVHVKDLERYFGVALFERLGAGVRLTETGQLVYGYAKRVLELVVELEGAVNDANDAGNGHLRIGSSTTPGTYLLPMILGRFRSRYPAVTIAVEIANTAAIAERLRHGDLHFGLLGRSIRDRELHLEPWIEDELRLILPVGHAWSNLCIDAQELLSQPLIAREEGSASDDVLRDALESAGVSSRPTLVLSSTEAVKNAVANNLCVAFVSSSAVERELAVGRLAQAQVAGLTIRRTFQLAHRTSRRLTAVDEAFVEVVRESGRQPVTSAP